MKSATFSSYGITAALEAVYRHQFDEAEARLREKMKPARLAASAAVIEELGHSEFRNPQSEILP